MVDSIPKRVASFGGLNFFKPENDYHITRLGQNENGKNAYSAMDGLYNLNPFHNS